MYAKRGEAVHNDNTELMHGNLTDRDLVAWVADFGENVRPVIFMGACDAA